jgi:hypothetical protein
MLLNSVPFIKYSGTLTVSSPGTAFLGWRADPAFSEGRRSGAKFFARQTRLFYRDSKLTSVTRTWYRQDSFIVTRQLTSVNRDWQKTRHPDADASLNRRAVSIHWLEKSHLDNYVMIPTFLFTMTNEC